MLFTFGKHKNSYIYTEFISHSRKGNRKTQVTGAMRFLLFIGPQLMFFYIFFQIYFFDHLYLYEEKEVFRKTIAWILILWDRSFL